MKKISILVVSLFLAASFLSVAANTRAMTPSLSVSTSGQSGDYVQISVTGDPGATAVNLFVGSQGIISLPSLNSNGTMTTTIGSAQTENGNFLIASNSIVYVKTGGLNGSQSNSVSWPYIQSSTSTGSLTLGQTAVLLNVGQSTTVTIYGGTGANFYVSSNSNPSIVQANITGNILTLIGSSSTGTSTINICVNGGSCGSVTANVSNAAGANGSIALSQTSVSILAGQSVSITISGGSAPYNMSSSNSTNIFNGSISGNTLTIYGVNPGSGTANICASTGCASLSVIINAVNSSTGVNQPTFSQNNILLTTGQQLTVYISGNSNYYVANNTYPGVASVMINANAATVSAGSAGSANISICQNGGQCATLYVTVSATAVTPTPIATQPTYVFIRYLGYNDKGSDVLELQKLLAKLGFLSATPNGHYGPSTVAGVKKFQSAHGIRQTGNVGPSTKDALNQITPAVATTSTTNASQISALQQQIQQLIAQVSAMTSSGQ